MSTDTVAVLVPAPLYQRLARLAALINRPVESLVAQTLSAGLPPLADDLPTTLRDALQALDQLDATALEQIVRERMPEAKVKQFAELRTAYAALLLKLRSQPV